MNETPQQYAQRVTGYLDGRDPMTVLSSTPSELETLIKGCSRTSLDAPPAPDKWSVTTIVAHLADSEIVYGFRLRLMVAASGCAIQATDQDAWAVAFDYAAQDPAVSIEDFRVNRARTLRMLEALSMSQWDCYGVHSERGRETVRRVVELVAGHDINHLRQIRAILGMRIDAISIPRLAAPSSGIP
jgi:hypothetical protein